MKKTLSLLLSLLMAAALLAGSALAGEALTMTVSSETAAAVGEEVTLSIFLTSNPGLATLDFTLNYEESALELVSMAFDTDFTAGGMPAVNTAGKQMTFVKMENTDYTGVIATVTFKVLKAGTATVTATIADCLDVNEDAVPCSSTTAQGSVTLPCSSHAWGQGVVTTEPGCESKGVRTYTCSACGGTRTEDIDPIGHDWDAGTVTTEPGCETAGVRTYTCGNDDSHTRTEDIDPVGHDWNEGVVTTEPGCETKGVRTYTCGNDDSHTRTEDIDPVGHDWNEGVVTTEPGCETAGVRTYTCGNDDSHTRTEDIDPVGHDWGEGTVTKEATLSEKGERLYTCKRDESHTKTEEIPMLKPAAPAPTDAPKSDIPKTGDEAQPVLWLVLMLAAAAMVGAFVVGRTRKN